MNIFSMRVSLILITFLLPGVMNGQSKYVGYWHDYFASGLKLNSDSTFEFTYRFDLINVKTSGKWTYINDTIYFKELPIKDTIKKIAPDEGIKTDLPVFSLKNSASVNSSSTVIPVELPPPSEHVPNKLYYHKDKLVVIDENNKLVKGRVRYIWTTKRNPNGL